MIRFMTSVADVKNCPAPDRPEFAFIGRSNVGKSSLINLLAGRKGIARISSSPGKTRTINHYHETNLDFYLVDLPGYGFAKVSKTERHALENMVRNYFSFRKNLTCTFVLIDSRHAPLKPDLDFLQWLAGMNKRFIILFTKADKNHKPALLKLKNEYLRKLELLFPGTGIQILPVSAVSRLGKEELVKKIREMLPTGVRQESGFL